MDRKRKKYLRGILFRHLDGIALCSTISTLHQNKISKYITDHSSFSIQELLSAFQCNSGYLNVSLRLLSSQGWLEQDIVKDGNNILYKLTEKAEDSEINKLSLDICESINKKTAIIYSGTNMSKVVSSRWKTQINENAKSKAFVGYLPEVHHNEILSWDADIDGSKNNYIVILIRDKNEHVQISKRFEFTKELIGDKVNIVEVNLNNRESTLKTLLELVLLGDLVSLNLANKLDLKKVIKNM